MNRYVTHTTRTTAKKQQSNNLKIFEYSALILKVVSGHSHAFYRERHDL